MDFIDILLLLLFISFLGVYLLKLILLKVRNKINANVLYKGNKESPVKRAEIFVKISSFLWMLTQLLEILFHKTISSYINPIFSNTHASYAAVVIMVLNVGIFTSATVFMKSSWRVGIDKNVKTKLIIDGVYSISRNPAFVGFDLMSISLFLAYPNLLTLLVLLVFPLSLHLLIVQEEKHLYSMFGEEYASYSRKVPRYLLFL